MLGWWFLTSSQIIVLYYILCIIVASIVFFINFKIINLERFFFSTDFGYFVSDEYHSQLFYYYFIHYYFNFFVFVLRLRLYFRLWELLSLLVYLFQFFQFKFKAYIKVKIVFILIRFDTVSWIISVKSFSCFISFIRKFVFFPSIRFANFNKQYWFFYFLYNHNYHQLLKFNFIFFLLNLYL